MKERLHKILARTTKLSRRAAEKAIAMGHVTVNGKIVKEMGVMATLGVDSIVWRGQRVRSSARPIYLKYNKPKGILVTKRDEEGRKTIWRDLRAFKDKVNSVGRLDYHSEGLLLLTNDGELINKLTHPSHEIQKLYRVKVKGHPWVKSLDRIRRGITFADIKYMPAEIKFIEKGDIHSWYEVGISEGKNRQIRNMFMAVGHPVSKLKRIAVGPIKLGDLAPGKFKLLTARELSLLKRALK